MKKITVVVLLLALVYTCVFHSLDAIAKEKDYVFTYYEYNSDTRSEVLKTLDTSNQTSYSSYEHIYFDTYGNVISRWTPEYNGLNSEAQHNVSSGFRPIAKTQYESDYTTIQNTTIAPYKYTGYIHYYVGDDPSTGDAIWNNASAFLVGPNTLVTAGHCCYTTKNGWTEQLYFYPAKDGSSMPYGSAERKSITVPSAWKNDGNNNYDWGIVTLKTAIGNTTGWFGILTQTSSFVGTNVTMAGYPYTLTNPYKMHSSSGSVAVCTDYKLYSSYNTYNGASGSPIYTNSTGGNTSIGVHTGYNSNYGALGVRFTQYFYNLIMQKNNEYLNSIS